jgi:putative CocE/NonD family hydrolase
VLVFTTPPLDENLEIVGPVTLRLWIASDVPDTDFTAKLLDVYPPSTDYPHGFAMNLTEGLPRMRYRDSWERPALMTPGEVYPIEIMLFPIANRFCRGHRLRLDISSSNFPHFDVNPNSGSRKDPGSTRASLITGSLSTGAGRRMSCCRWSRPASRSGRRQCWPNRSACPRRRPRSAPRDAPACAGDAP